MALKKEATHVRNSVHRRKIFQVNNQRENMSDLHEEIKHYELQV